MSYLVGKRDADYANDFMMDVAHRLANSVQFTTYGHGRYLRAVEEAFGGDIGYAMLVKHYGEGSKTDQRRYSAAQLESAEVRLISGYPL